MINRYFYNDTTYLWNPGHSLNIFLNQNMEIVQNKDAAKTKKKKSTFFDYVFSSNTLIIFRFDVNCTILQYLLQYFFTFSSLLLGQPTSTQLQPLLVNQKSKHKRRKSSKFVKVCRAAAATLFPQSFFREIEYNFRFPGIGRGLLLFHGTMAALAWQLLGQAAGVGGTHKNSPKKCILGFLNLGS